ncbi:MAG: choice-of-anchor B family protein [Planctomycetes bacterium]|nr:choice-of-anchor B family protein [Planctomycetota bacterium]
MRRGRGLFGAITLTLIAGAAIGHQGDPKLLSIQPPFGGTGYTAGAGAGQSLPIFPVGGGISLDAWLTATDLGFPGQHCNDCWGYVSPSGREYALIGTTTATVFVEVTTPSQPVVVGSITGGSHINRDMKVFGHYAYSVTEAESTPGQVQSGIQVIDLSAIDSGTVTLAYTAFSAVKPDTHNIALDTTSGFLYRCGGDTDYGLRIYDLNPDPVHPTYVSSWHVRYVHDACVVTKPDGQEIAFCCTNHDGSWPGGEPRLTILDVTDKLNIITLSDTSYPNGRFAHQAWPTPDLQYLYLTDEGDELPRFSPGTKIRIFNISSLTSPQYVGELTNGSTAVDHNVFVKGNKIYAANYRSGLRIFNASNPANPVETKYYDTYPADDDPLWNGLWGVYPFLPSGTIIASDMERGLFILHE